MTENTINDSEFELMLDQYNYDNPHRGQILEGTILSVNQDEILVDVGLKRDAIVTRKDLSLLSDHVKKRLIPGEEVLTYVLQPRNNDGNLIVSINKAMELEDWRNAKTIHESDGMVDVTVIDANRGGLLVRYGRLTGFVPQSHITSLPRFTSDYELEDAKKTIVGKGLSLKFIEIDRKRNRLIMSERLAAAETRQNRLSELNVGDKVTGRVASIVNFGAFVDLGGVDGLIHISKIDHRHINHPGEVLTIGDEIEVLIDEIDEENNRISLSRVALLADPWQAVLDEYKVGDLIEGKVTNVTDFGVFVQLPNHLQGLVHSTKMTMFGSGNPRDMFREGDPLLVRIISIEPERQRIGMSIDDVTVEEQEEWMIKRRGDEGLDDTLSEEDFVEVEESELEEVAEEVAEEATESSDETAVEAEVAAEATE